MNELRHLGYLAGMARWCLSRYEGILTPTGKPKKAPTFYVLKCDRDHLTLTSTKTAKAERFICSEMTASKEKTKNPSRPRTLVCREPTTIIEEITNDVH